LFHSKLPLAAYPAATLIFVRMDWRLLLSHWRVYIFVAFCLVTLVQLFYYLFFFLRVALYKSKDKFQSQTQPVSVIVCARDEAHNLENNLPALLTQTYTTTHEVVLVNDNSFDDTKFFAEELSRIFKKLNAINLTQEAKHIPGKKYPLSIGIKSSKYEVMLLTDADCMPASENWIQKMQDAYSDGIEIILGYGAYKKEKGFLNKLVRFETFHAAVQYLSYALAGYPYMGVGRNLSYRKDLFFRVKGFSSINHIPGGDDDMFINKVANKTNTAIVIDKDAFTISEAPKTFYQWWRQKTRHYSTARFYKPLHQFLLSLYAASHFFFYPLFIAAIIFFDWRIVLGVFAARLITQAIVWYKTMNRLNEKDLFPIFWLLDIWQFFYYIIFSFALVKKPRSNWK
jgi:glycosyltransferase involved in cell wall biosynthesis